MASTIGMLNSHAGESSRLHVVRKPSVRVRQAVRDNNVALLARLQHKMDLRNVDKMRLSSLAWAALEGHIEVFEWLLLDYGHDDQELSRDAEHNTIFHLLAAAPAPPSLSPHAHLLTSDPDFPPRPTTRSIEELTDISLRMTEVYCTLFPFLIDWSNTGGKVALHFAAQANNASFIALLCDLGADTDLADLQGNTPLHYASAWGHIQCIRALLERGASTSARNFEGFNAADFAYSSQVRAQLDTIAREVMEERRTRRREERAAREARERELAEREQWELQMAEREQQEREMHDQALHNSQSYLPYEETPPPNVTAPLRIRSSSMSTSASATSGISSAHSSTLVREPEPPVPQIPPDVVAAATAAALSRNELRSQRAPSRAESFASLYPERNSSGSPTPMATRQLVTIPVPGHSQSQGSPAGTPVSPTPPSGLPRRPPLPQFSSSGSMPGLPENGSVHSGTPTPTSAHPIGLAFVNQPSARPPSRSHTQSPGPSLWRGGSRPSASEQGTHAL